METQNIFVQIYDIDGNALATTTDVVSANGSYALNRIGQGSFRVPANSPIAPHLEVPNHAWIRTLSKSGNGTAWHIQYIIISSVTQTDTKEGSFIDVQGDGTESLLNFRRTGFNTFDSDISPVLPAIMDFAPLFTYEVTGAATAPSRPIYIISTNHSVLDLLRQAKEQTGDSFFIDPLQQRLFWYGDDVASGLVFDETGANLPIINIKRTIKGESPITKLKAFGAGTGTDALRLDTVPLTNEDKLALEAQFPGINWSPQMYLWKPSLELLGHSLKDGEVKFPYIKPRAEAEDEVGYDAAAELYKAVYILNQTAGSYFAAQTISRTSYEITTIYDETFDLPVGKTARLTYNNTLDPQFGEYTVDEDLRIQSISHHIDNSGIRYSTIVLSNSTDEWLDENQKIVKKILEHEETLKSTSNPPTSVPSVIPVQHHSLQGLDDDDHPQYLRADGGTPLVGNLVVGGNYTIDGVDVSAFKSGYDAHTANSSAHHAPVTIGAGGLSGKLALTGQQLTLGTIAHNETTGRTANDHHNQVHSIIGSDHTASGNRWNILGLAATNALGVLSLNAIGTSLVPELTDTYDIGSATKLWRKGWLSELESIRFVENAITVMGGWFMVPHGSGTLQEDVDEGMTQIDFGTALSANDFVVLRANLQLEYMKIVGLASGTIYNVTRNVDGTGINEWPQGTPFVILGNVGDGRIEFDAQTAGPRISVLEQGATYNSQTERVRIGDMAGWGSYSGYGIGVGSAAGDRMAYTPISGFGIVAGGGNVSIDSNGITMIAAANQPAGVASQAIDWLYTGTSTLLSQIAPWANATLIASQYKVIGGNTRSSSLYLNSSTANSTLDTGIELRADRGGNVSFITVQNTPSLNKINLYADRTYSNNKHNVIGGLAVGHATYSAATGAVVYTGALTAYRNSVAYVGYIYVPYATQKTHTSYDGDPKNATNNILLDLPTLFTTPALAKAVYVRLSVRSATVGDVAYMGPSSTNSNQLVARVQTANIYQDESGMVNCDANGKVYITFVGTMDTIIEIWGYWI